jgi:hypothetical protein
MTAAADRANSRVILGTGRVRLRAVHDGRRATFASRSEPSRRAGFFCVPPFAKDDSKLNADIEQIVI